MNRKSWRLWLNKLYVSLDLQKLDEAVQACGILIDIRVKSNESDKVPPLEEKCVRAIVGLSVAEFKEANVSNDVTTKDSIDRSVSRVKDLLEKISGTAKSDPWVFEIKAYYYQHIGLDDQVLGELMKEYRSLQCTSGWETDALSEVYRVVSQISEIHLLVGSKDDLTKFRFLLNGVIKRIETANVDKIPAQIQKLEMIMVEVKNKIASSE